MTPIREGQRSKRVAPEMAGAKGYPRLLLRIRREPGRANKLASARSRARKSWGGVSVIHLESRVSAPMNFTSPRPRACGAK